MARLLQAWRQVTEGTQVQVEQFMARRGRIILTAAFRGWQAEANRSAVLDRKAVLFKRQVPYFKG